MTLPNLNDLYFFVQAVEHGGFSAAGRRLGLPKSTVSKRVAELEDRLGVRLIQRTSRSFSLTDLGRDFFRHAQASVIEAEMAETIVRTHLGEPSGIVRMTAAVPTAQFVLADHLAELSARYPRLHLSLHVSDRFVDIVQEGFDIAVRSHQAPLPDSTLLRKKLATDPFSSSPHRIMFAPRANLCGRRILQGTGRSPPARRIWSGSCPRRMAKRSS